MRKDCTIRVEGNSYVVDHFLVGEKLLARKKDRTLRIFQDDRLIVTYPMPEGGGHLVQDERFYRVNSEGVKREDREMQARKFDRPGNRSGKPKARAKTISPSAPSHPVEVAERYPEVAERYPIEVEARDLSVYQRLGGAVAYEEIAHA